MGGKWRAETLGAKPARCTLLKDGWCIYASVRAHWGAMYA